ncbi:MAG: Gfo/Idh/MocA family oxidoreductase [Betaproteobacteria bacterium]|nr:Gfo/Idh/MocA family oxidoreductase [Betaproteobacteria bacterium]
MLNAAIIGLGWWGKNLVDAIQDKSERIRFVHGVTKEPDVARELAARHGFRLSTELPAALADPQVQAVVLATPHSLHADQIVQVAAAGKPVFCEKPLALRRADAARAIAACERAGVPIGVGQNKRFWPSMRELVRVVQSGVLGRVLHIEGHYSNENSSRHFSAWRHDPHETPGAGLTGTGIHLLDAFSALAGPAGEVTAQCVATRGGPDPLDTVSALFKFENGLTGILGAVRATPIYWRVHVFGDKGNAEALGETELVLRMTGHKPEHRSFEQIDSLRAELEAFADAATGRSAYPITPRQMVDTIGAFEAIVRSIECGGPVRVSDL